MMKTLEKEVEDLRFTIKLILPYVKDELRVFYKNVLDALDTNALLSFEDSKILMSLQTWNAGSDEELKSQYKEWWKSTYWKSVLPENPEVYYSTKQ